MTKDEEANLTREDMESLEGTVMALELMLGVVILGVCSGRTKDFAVDILSAFDSIPDALLSRYDLDSKPALKRNVIETINEISRNLRSQLDL